MFATVRNFLVGSRTERTQADETSWLRDPLSHPVLERMTPDELADLPLGRVLYADNGNGCGTGRLCA